MSGKVVPAETIAQIYPPGGNVGIGGSSRHAEAGDNPPPSPPVKEPIEKIYDDSSTRRATRMGVGLN